LKHLVTGLLGRDRGGKNRRCESRLDVCYPQARNLIKKQLALFFLNLASTSAQIWNRLALPPHGAQCTIRSFRP
jgi:hypothetical protein